MSKRCPVCGQTLPKGMNAAQLHRRLEKIGAAATNKMRHDLERQFKQRFADKETDLRKRAIKDAQKDSRAQVATIQRNAKREAARAAKEAMRQSQQEIDSVNERAAKERAQHLADNARQKITIDKLSQQLERQTSEQMGEMGEAELYTSLKRTFPSDDVQRIGKGVRGADILQKVIANSKEVGRIVYECKNVSTWQNECITKAKRYRTEYQTPWVIIAARTLPRRQKWFVVEKSVPVIDFRLTVKLAEIMRSAVIEIGQLRTSHVGRQAKADQMFEYILSNHFVSRFKGVAEAVAVLREHQQKEQRWHRESWAKQSHLYNDMEQGQDEINAQIRAISETTLKPRLKVVGGNHSHR